MVTRIGLDFGTANTVVARWDDEHDRGEPVPLDGIDLVREAGHGVHQRVVPSLVAYSTVSEQRWLGAQVLSRPELRTDPRVSVFESMKSNVTGRAVDVPRAVGDRKLSAREAATRFLGDVMAVAVLTVDVTDLEIVVTAPVETFDAYRDWLVREVAVGLGDARLRVVDEATAAAAGYTARSSPGETFCVVDFGAGTLDVSVVRVQQPDATGGGAGVRTIAKAGVDLGGNHIDAVVAEHAANRSGLASADPVTYNRVFRQLLTSAEAAKVALTSGEHAVVHATDPATGVRYHAELTRTEFERLLRDRDVLGRFNRTLRRTLDTAAARGHPADGIGHVFLVGGTCLVPAVQDVVRTQFDPGIVHLDRPLEAVAAGAAVIAGGYELHDHIQHDYAIRHLDPDTGDYAFETLVQAGTEYPTVEPVRSLTVKAVWDGQEELGLAVYELAHATYRDGGADLEIVFDRDGGARTVPVGRQRRQEQAMRWLNEDNPTFLRADPPARAGADRFRLQFHVDAQKRLTVTVFDLERGTRVLDRQPVVRLV